MSNNKKMTMLQLEKSYETATKAKIKLQLIERNKSTIFPSDEDYEILKETYSLEREYAIKKCRDIVDTDEELKSKKKWYDFFKSYYESRQMMKDIMFLFIPFIVITMVLGYFYKQSLLWMIACLDLIAIGAGFAIYAFSKSNKKKAVSDDKEYLAPTNMQIKVLREIDRKLLNGEIYEEIVKDCQLQFAKRRLTIQRTNNLTNNYSEEETNVNVEEDIVDIFFGKEPEVKYSYEKTSTPKSKKKASESSVYAKYMQIKNDKKPKKVREVAPESAIRSDFKSMANVKSFELNSYKDNKQVKKFVSSLDILRKADTATITTVANVKPTMKKASTSPTYQKYMEMKLAKQESKN